MADAEKVIKALELCASGCDNDGCIYLEEQNNRGGLAICRCVDLMARDALELLKSQQAEIAELIRCKDCVYWKPPHIRLNDGKQRAYKESDRGSNPFGMLSVTMDVGINVGGKCWVDHNAGYSEDKRVFRSKNDFCSKAIKLPDGETNESWWGLSEEPSELIDD